VDLDPVTNVRNRGLRYASLRVSSRSRLLLNLNIMERIDSSAELLGGRDLQQRAERVDVLGI
jgi:hypothetical protein